MRTERLTPFVPILYENGDSGKVSRREGEPLAASASNDDVQVDIRRTSGGLGPSVKYKGDEPSPGPSSCRPGDW